MFTEYAASPNTHPNIPNCSYAGYRYSEIPLPSPPIVANVRTFGAKGDGKTDDTLAFQRAIAYTQSKKGTISVPIGKYRLTGMLPLTHSHIVLRGEDPQKSVLSFEKSLTDIFGPLLDGADSEYSWSGGLIHVGPKGDFTKDGSMDPNARYGWEVGDTIGSVSAPAKRGDFRIALAPHATQKLKAHQKIFLGWKNIPDHSLYTHMCGHPLMGKFPWESQGQTMAKWSRWWWPVEIHAIEKSHIVLKQPLRIDIRPQWEVAVATANRFVEEVGIENLTIEMPSRLPNPHLKDKGFNAIFMTKTFHSWIRNVTIANPDNGVILEATKNISVSHLTLHGGRHHHGTFTSGSHDTLISDFHIASWPLHGINVQALSTGNVWRRGKMDHGTFDSHRMLPFDMIRTDITIHNDGQPGGDASFGPIQGARVVHWNLRVSGHNAWVYQPDIMPMGTLVGIQGIPMNTQTVDDGMVPGDKGCIVGDHGQVPSPSDLFEAQLRLRRKDGK